MRPQAFWDASALVPLCVPQPISAWAEQNYLRYDAAVWWATAFEIASALARLRRTGELATEYYLRAKRMAGELARHWTVVGPSDGILARAQGLVESFPLRAADAVQLAAALAWREGEAGGAPFWTADERLRTAAARLGFRVDEIGGGGGN